MVIKETISDNQKIIEIAN